MRSPQETLTTAPHPCMAPHCQQVKGQATVRFQSLSRQADLPSSAAPLHTSTPPGNSSPPCHEALCSCCPSAWSAPSLGPGLSAYAPFSAHPRGLRPGPAGCLGEAHISVIFKVILLLLYFIMYLEEVWTLFFHPSLQ